MKLEIVHSTHYQYTGPIAESVMEVRLRPMDGAGQRCLDFSLELSAGIKPRSYRDGYGNNVHYFNLVKPHSRLSITGRSTVETGLAPDSDQGEELVQDFLRFRSPVKDVAGVRELALKHPIVDPDSPEAVERALDQLTRPGRCGPPSITCALRSAATTATRHQHVGSTSARRPAR